MIPEHYLRIARRWFWLIGMILIASVGIATIGVPRLRSAATPGHSAAMTLGVTRLVSASGSVTTAGGTGTPQLLTSYTQNVADRGNTPQFQKELQDRLALQGLVIDAGVLARKVTFKADTGLFRIAITASAASGNDAALIAETAAQLVIDDVTAEEARVKVDLTTTTAQQQTQLLAQLNTVYAARTAELATIGEPLLSA